MHSQQINGLIYITVFALFVANYFGICYLFSPFEKRFLLFGGILCDPGLKPSGDIFYKKGETNTTHSGIVNRELQLETKGHRCFWEQVASVLICIVIFDLKPCEMMRSKPLLCKL